MRKNSYNEQDILASTQGKLFGKDCPRLPADNMLMVSRIEKITADNGEFNKGYIEASFDINPSLWFFDCHFIEDPVMPGCLGLDSLWQLVGFFLAWSGYKGKGRALGVGEVKFKGEVLPTANLVQYYIDIKKIMNQKLVMGIANGKVKVDGKLIYTAKDLKVGFFNA